MSTIALPPSDSNAAPLSEPARIIDTFVAPSKTFTDLRRSAAWWGPFLLTAVVLIAFAYSIDKKIGFQKVAENNIQMSPKMADRLERLSPVEREADLKGRTILARYFSYGFAIPLLIINLILAGILFITFKFGVSADVKFSTSLAIVFYAGLPGILKIILAVASIWAGLSAESFSSTNPLASNPGYFLTPSDSPGLYTFASQFDVFTIWTLILVAIGFTCVAKIKRSTSYIVVFGWFAVATLLFTGLAAAFS